MTTHSGLNSPIVTSNDETTAATPQRIDLAELEDLRSHWKINCTDQHADELFSQWIGDRKEEIMAELKRMYEREDFLMKAREMWLIEERRLEKKVEVSQKEMRQSLVRTSDIEKALRKALRIIRDDLDEVTSNPINEVEKDKLLKKIRNFANDASQ